MATDELTRDEFLRYSRHLLIPEIGLAGQKKLKRSSALILGTGGLGSPVSMYLAAAGVGHIGIVDYDVVDESNLQRQIVHGQAAIGMLKVESAKNRLLDINPHIKVTAFNEPFTSANAMRIARGFDIIVDCTDNFPTRYLSNDVAVILGIPNVYGSIYRFDGQVSVFGMPDGPCYRCVFPEPPPPGLVPTCSDGGVLGVLPGIIGSLQANEAIKVLLGIGEIASGKLLLLDALSFSFDTVTIRKNPNCKVCGTNPEIIELIDYDQFCGVPGFDHQPSVEREFVISPVQLKNELASIRPPLLIDVREPHELEISNIEGAINIPLHDIFVEREHIPRDHPVVLFCKRGSRSVMALNILLKAGFSNIRHLDGGINRWVEQFDQSQPVY
ncbi:MAG TPA: molybdopterin-synthase adenylyltransferase MoeB [Anaerolineales bacterium]|nr:molybdopterin-synthase adenylyltransferase MoeB [Anaerolineales bacterium]